MVFDYLKTTKPFLFLRLLYRGYGQYKKKIVFLTALGFLSGLLEAVGINLIIPFFSFITGGGGSGTDIVTRIVEQLFFFFNFTYSLRFLLVFIIVLFILRAVTLLWSNYIQIKIAAGYEKSVRGNLFSKTLQAHWPFLLKQKLGHLESLLMINIQFSVRLLKNVSSITLLLTSLFMYLLVAVTISFSITLFTLSLGGVLFFVLKPILLRIRQFAKESERINREIAHHVNENIVGMKTVKSLSIVDKAIDVSLSQFEKLKDLKIKISFLQVAPIFLMQPIALIFIISVFAFSYKTTDFNIASFAVIVYFIQRMFQYIQQIQSQFQLVVESTPYLQELLKYEEEAKANKELDKGTKPFSFTEKLEFKDISFSYIADTSVLKHIDFSVKRGEMIGLVGQSGSGKTTVVDLLLRLFEPNAGTITVDGVNINEIKLAQWRENIGYVPQDIFLLNGTIAENIRFYNSLISDKEIEKAAKMAHIYDFICELPRKFKTVVGERGIMLSSGQRQRIVIARILVRTPSILILDEATSSLDSESEANIQKVIEDLKGKVTVVVIAHRLSTVVNADKIAVLDKGEVVEFGAPKKLLQDPQSYFSKVYKDMIKT